MLDWTRANAVPCRLFDKQGYHIETQHWGEQWVLSRRALEFIDAEPLSVDAPLESVINQVVTVRRFERVNLYARGRREKVLGADYLEQGSTVKIEPDTRWLLE